MGQFDAQLLARVVSTAAFPTYPVGSLGPPSMDNEGRLQVGLSSGGTSANVESANPVTTPNLDNFFGLTTIAGNYLSDGVNFVAQTTYPTNSDNIATVSGNGGVAAVQAGVLAFDGTTYDRVRTASAANQSAANPVGVLQTANVGTFGIQNTPAAASQATISRAAGGAGIRHIATAVTVGIAAVAAQPPLIFNLRDGASGAGTILWSVTLTAAAGTGQVVALSGLSIPGTVNTTMTLESAAAPAATNFAFVSLSGYSVA